MSERRQLRELLIKHEGLKLKPYLDTVGKLTIGVGRNLDDVGISELEAMAMLSADMDRVSKAAVDAFPWFQSLSATRQDVVLSMIFQLGLGGFREFKKAIEAIRCGNFNRAADEMLDSKWAKQDAPARAAELAYMMRRDFYLPASKSITP